MIRNLFLLFVASTICILIVEFFLRLFYGYPISTTSNQIVDDVLGYRVDTRLDGIDQHGFRNPETLVQNPTLAAIGDSHTYGSNLSADLAWPSQFLRKYNVPTYNYGIGSYGIYTYHPLVSKAVSKKSKGIVVALYPPNDFSPQFSYCEIDANSEYWSKQKIDLNLKFPSCQEKREEKLSNTRLYDKLRSFFHKRTAVGFLIVNFVRPIKSQIFNPPIAGTNEIVTPWNVKEFTLMMDLDNSGVKAITEDMDRFFREWSKIAESNNIVISLLVIPSKQLVLSEFARDRGTSQESQEIIEVLRRESDISQLIFDAAEKNGLPITSALPEMVRAKKDVKNGYLYFGDGHPKAEGQNAYAEAAMRLLQMACLQDQRKPLCSELSGK